MKTFTAVLLALTWSFAVAAADHTAEIKQVHLCCKGCTSAAEQAVGKIPGASAQADSETGTVTLHGPNEATLQKAADALVAAGFYGKPSDAKLKLQPKTGAQGKSVKSLKVAGVHLCCGECVSAVEKAANSVSGVKGHTAVKGAKTFEVTGDFKDTEFFEALQKQGLSGTVAK